MRQEKIAPPNKLRSEVTLEDKKQYKEKLLRSIQVHYPFIKKIDMKSDYYIYFYFHGLSLLNDKGIFCFITSNSWLDVGYGKDLQEFLLKYCHIKAIYDNEAKRSFEHADVNTIIALLGPPMITKNGKDWNALKETARFVMFKKPFEEVINTKNLLAIEKASSVQKTDSYRVYPVKQETLLEEGWEIPEEDEEIQEKNSTKSKKTAKSFTSLYKEKFVSGRYEGNKWGGKYLRAPDIFFTILEKGKGKMVRLGDIAEVRRGFTTGANEFFYLDEARIKEWGIEEEFLKPVIKSPRECKSILIKPEDLKYKVFMCHKDKKDLKGTNALKYIEWGEKQGFHKRPTCASRQRWWDLGEPLLSNYLWTMTYRERFFVVKNNLVYADARFYDMYSSDEVGALVNSTFCLFWLELQARGYGGGGGPVDVKVYEVLNLNIPLPPESYKNNIFLLLIQYI